MDNYDNWKLDNGETDIDYCDICETECNTLNEVSFLDADRDHKTLWLCQHCDSEEKYLE